MAYMQTLANPSFIHYVILSDISHVAPDLAQRNAIIENTPLSCARLSMQQSKR